MESGGRGPLWYFYGLWQIADPNPPGATNAHLLDPVVNTEAAAAKYSDGGRVTIEMATETTTENTNFGWVLSPFPPTEVVVLPTLVVPPIRPAQRGAAAGPGGRDDAGGKDGE